MCGAASIPVPGGHDASAAGTVGTVGETASQHAGLKLCRNSAIVVFVLTNAQQSIGSTATLPQGTKVGYCAGDRAADRAIMYSR